MGTGREAIAMPSMEIKVDEVEFKIHCECGKDLGLQCGVESNGYEGMRFIEAPHLKVEPCPDCIEKAREEGYDAGREDEAVEE